MTPEQTSLMMSAILKDFWKSWKNTAKVAEALKISHIEAAQKIANDFSYRAREYTKYSDPSAWPTVKPLYEDRVLIHALPFLEDLAYERIETVRTAPTKEEFTARRKKLIADVWTKRQEGMSCKEIAKFYHMAAYEIHGICARKRQAERKKRLPLK